ncbi:c-type cytochrome [Aggregatilinea lenta]|uniref:c-type cytochrome n=1 Tax=Aggregatilinea lenta TaxID=913108 RepID=UPI0013C30EDC|nr:cytochrome c [Aggregatilinea lenta]
MSKRMWVVTLIIAALAVTLAACSGGDLAEDLTPIPTLPPGQTPTLVAALPGAATEEAADNGGDEQQVSGTEEAGTEGTAEASAGGTAEAGDAGAGEGDATVGEEIFSASCSGCHGEADGAGPARAGMGERAATRVEGMSAAEYLHQSIVDPSAHVVEGFSDIMPKDYAEQFSDDEINGLVAYLLTQ